MNLSDLLEEAISLESVAQNPDLKFTDAAQIVMRHGYPMPDVGVSLIAGLREPNNNNIDFAVRHLRKGVLEILEGVIGDCAQVIRDSRNVEDDAKRQLIDALYDHFDMSAPLRDI